MQFRIERLNWKNDRMSPFEVFFFRYTKPPQIEEAHVSCRKAQNRVTITKTRVRSRRWTAKAAAVTAYAGPPAERLAKARLNDSRLINSFTLIYRHIPEEIKQVQSSRVTKNLRYPSETLPARTLSAPLLRGRYSGMCQITAHPQVRSPHPPGTVCRVVPVPPSPAVCPPLHSGLRPGPAQPGLKRSRLRQRRPAARKEKGELPLAQGGEPPRCACAVAGVRGRRDGLRRAGSWWPWGVRACPVLLLRPGGSCQPPKAALLRQSAGARIKRQSLKKKTQPQSQNALI